MKFLEVLIWKKKKKEIKEGRDHATPSIVLHTLTPPLLIMIHLIWVISRRLSHLGKEGKTGNEHGSPHSAPPIFRPVVGGNIFHTVHTGPWIF